MIGALQEYLIRDCPDGRGTELLAAAEDWGKDRNGAPSIEELWREWYPLRGALLPIGVGCAEDPWVIPCAAPACAPDYPVFLWDFLAGLNGQLDEPVVASFEEWRLMTRNDRSQLIAETVPQLQKIQQESDRETHAALQLFERVAGRFAAESSGYDHDKGGALPRPKAWRPIRVACKDVLLAVCAIRFNREKLMLDVCAWAAADHTMFARGSGTQNALELVVADAVKCGAVKGIRFLESDGPNAQRIRLPRDIAAVRRILGTRPSEDEDGVLAGPALGRLARFLASTTAPFPAVEIQRSWVDQPAKVSGIDEGELLHLVRKGIWSPEEVAAISTFCPMATDTLRGRLDPQQDGMIFDVAWAHLRAARLAELAARELLGSAAPTVRDSPDEPQPSEFTQHEFSGSPYGRVLRHRGGEVTLSLNMLAEDGSVRSCPKTVRAGDDVRLVPAALPARILSWYFSQENTRGQSDEIIVVPADVRVLSSEDRIQMFRAIMGRPLMVCESDLLTIDEDLLQSVRDARRLGSIATVLERPSHDASAASSPVGVVVRRLDAADHEDPSVLEQLILLLDRLERGLDPDRSRQAAVRLLGLRAAQASGGQLCMLQPKEVSSRRSLRLGEPRLIVQGIRLWEERASLGPGDVS